MVPGNYIPKVGKPPIKLAAKQLPHKVINRTSEIKSLTCVFKLAYLGWYCTV